MRLAINSEPTSQEWINFKIGICDSKAENDLYIRQKSERVRQSQELEQLKLKFYSILFLLYSDQHWRSTATCAAALGLPNLNYVQGLNWL